MPILKGVTLLITHYNRSESLARLLQSFHDLDLKFEDIVVSDDGSTADHLQQIHLLEPTYGIRVVTTPVNKGLGNNINKGQDAVTTPYTLYVQEDFIPTYKFVEKITPAIAFMDQDPELDVVRFYAYTLYPFLQPFKDGFYRMKFRIWYSGYHKFYLYSDHPHLRRSSFLEKFGRYREGLKVERTEYWMMISFLKHQGKALFYRDFQSLFVQINTSHEPSTVKRNFWRESGNPLVGIARHCYRHFRFNFDFFKFK